MHAGARPLELSYGLAVERLERPMAYREGAGEMLVADTAVVLRLDVAAFVIRNAAALAHPRGAGPRQTFLHIDRDVRIGIGARRVIDRHRRLGGRLRQHDLPHRHPQVGRFIRRRIDFAGARDRSGGDLRDGNIAIKDVHGSLSRFRACAWREVVRPFAGMTRIRFEGSPRRLQAKAGRYLSSLPELPSERI